MEINRHLKVGYAVQSEAPKLQQAERAATSRAAGDTGAAASSEAPLPLERMQEALRALPDVDLDKVAALRQALQRGELASDSASLAASMLDYHGGKLA
jgi:negative regulator of flagellin synthesis FlgM